MLELVGREEGSDEHFWHVIPRQLAHVVEDLFVWETGGAEDL